MLMSMNSAKTRHHFSRDTRLVGLLVVWALILQGTFQVALCDSKGKIAGRVRDSQTGQPLPSVNVTIERTNLGAATDVAGDYYIINIPPGIYSVKASVTGYTSLVQSGVRVDIDQTTRLDFTLTEQSVELQEIVVVAGRPTIQMDIGGSKDLLDGSEIASLPVSEFKEVLDKEAGMKEADMRGLFIRGERESAMSLRIDGMETRDNLDNQVETRVNPDALEEASVMKGGYGAEYGNASSGVINLVMKEGGSTYEGTFDGLYGVPTQKHFGESLKQLYDDRFDNVDNWTSLAGRIDTSNTSQYRNARAKQIYSQFMGKPKLLRELYRWRMRDEVTRYGNKPDLNIKGTFGGPVPFVDLTTFFLSGYYERSYYLFNQAYPYFKHFDLTAKLTTSVLPNLKISLTHRYTEKGGISRYDRKDVDRELENDDPLGTRENRYLFENEEDIALTAAGEANHLTHWPYVDRMSIASRFRNQTGIRLTHALSPSTFHELSLSFNDFRTHAGLPPLRDTTQTVTLRDEDGNVAILTGEYALAPAGYWYDVGLTDPPLNMGQANILGGTHGAFEGNRDRSFNIKYALTSQVNKTNLVGLGAEFNYVDLLKDERREGSDNNRFQWFWHVYPKALGIWAQDKLEFEGMIATVGLRADARIPERRWFNLFDDATRWDYHWSDYFRAGYLGPDSISAGPTYAPSVRWVLSPRFSISHPIGTDAKIYFNYSHQNIDPPYEYQYRIEKRSLVHGWDVFGNPGLPPIRTIQYEIGYEQAIADVLVLKVSGYYKDVDNKLVEVQYVGLPRQRGATQYSTTYRSYAPDEYFNARGFEIRLEKRLGKFWTGWANYNYDEFRAGQRGVSIFYEDPTRAPLERNYTQRTPAPQPRINIDLDLHTPPGFGPALGSFYPLADIRVNILFWWRAQPSFTYNPNRLTAPYDPRDNKQWKAHHAVDFMVTKRFEWGAHVVPVLYVQVVNLFNTKNMNRFAFLDPGDVAEPAWSQRDAYVRLLEEQGGAPGEREDLALQAIGNNPAAQGPGSTTYDLYLHPRQIYLGIRFEFK
jgi:hypothetical protein